MSSKEPREKILFKVRRTKFENLETLQQVRKCFNQAQVSLIPKAISKFFQIFLTKASNQILIGLVATLLAFFLKKYFKYELIICFVISLFAIISSIYAILSFYFYKLWKEYIIHVKKDSDISYKNATTIYSKEENAFFIATINNSENEIIAIGGVIIHNEKNNYKEPACSELVKDHALFLRIGVLPEYHGNGVGKAIVKSLIDFAKEKNAKKIVLNTSCVQEAAINLYKSIGFKVVKEICISNYFQFIILTMELDLNQ